MGFVRSATPRTAELPVAPVEFAIRRERTPASTACVSVAVVQPVARGKRVSPAVASATPSRASAAARTTFAEWAIPRLPVAKTVDHASRVQAQTRVSMASAVAARRHAVGVVREARVILHPWSPVALGEVLVSPVSRDAPMDAVQRDANVGTVRSVLQDKAAPMVFASAIRARALLVVATDPRAKSEV
jgi:hypothetical protein